MRFTCFYVCPIPVIVYVAILEQVINDYEQVGEVLEDSSDQPENIYENITDEPTYENIYEKVMEVLICVVMHDFPFTMKQ